MPASRLQVLGLVLGPAFPFARVARSAPVAIVADIVMLVAFCWLAWHSRNAESDRPCDAGVATSAAVSGMR